MNEQNIAIIIGVVIAVILVFLVLREVVCWYFKINERNNLLREQVEQNKHILTALTGSIDSDKSLDKNP